jgi:hypothetical protein
MAEPTNPAARLLQTLRAMDALEAELRALASGIDTDGTPVDRKTRVAAAEALLESAAMRRSMAP